MTPASADSLARRAEIHAALGEPVRLRIVDDLTTCDRSPGELCDRLGLSPSLLAHHIDVLEDAGLVLRAHSHSDRRRRYLRLSSTARAFGQPTHAETERPMDMCIFQKTVVEAGQESQITYQRIYGYLE